MPTPTLCNVSSRYGAPMGRPELEPADKTIALRFHLVRVRIDSGGYDSGGAYWGSGLPLYWAKSVEEVPTTMWVPRDPEVSSVEFFTRAKSRAEAKAHVRAEYPNAKFFR